MMIKDLFGRVLKKDYSFHEKYTSSFLLSMIKDDSKLISDWKSIGIIAVCVNVLSIVVTFPIISLI